MHTASREMVYVAEQGLLADRNTLDPTWQEMLNHATAKVQRLSETLLLSYSTASLTHANAKLRSLTHANAKVNSLRARKCWRDALPLMVWEHPGGAEVVTGGRGVACTCSTCPSRDRERRWEERKRPNQKLTQ